VIVEVGGFEPTGFAALSGELLIILIILLVLSMGSMFFVEKATIPMTGVVLMVLTGILGVNATNQYNDQEAAFKEAQLVSALEESGLSKISVDDKEITASRDGVYVECLIGEVDPERFVVTCSE